MSPAAEDVLKANQIVHSSLLETGEYLRSPHFRPENQARVSEILAELADRTPSRRADRRLLDIGCGTGFVLSLALPFFDELHGIDITSEMLEAVDTSSGRITVKTAQAEKIPYEDLSFDMVTAYSFLDHLLDYKPVFDEAHRVLRSGGIFYSDLNPSRHFALMLNGIEESQEGVLTLPQSIVRELEGVLHNGGYYADNFGIDAATLQLAEPIKTDQLGFDADEVCAYASSIGFSEVRCEYAWFLGQSQLSNSESSIEIDSVEAYLQMLLPATRDLFKYLRFVFTK